MFPKDRTIREEFAVKSILLVTTLLFLAIPALAQDAPKKPTSQPAAKGKTVDLGPFSIPLATGWVEQKPTSNMRVVQAELPAPTEDGKPAALVAYYFGSGQGGDVKANIARWKGQFERPEGLTDEQFSTESHVLADGLPVTVVEVRGRYIGTSRPGQPAPTPIADARMFGVIVETSKGSYFIKVEGPRATVEHHKKGLDAMVVGILRAQDEPAAKKGD